MASEQRRVFLLCQRLLQDPDEANSATQDVFLKALRSLSSQQAAVPDHPEKWVTRIAVNTCLDRLRSNAWKIWRRRPQPKDEEVLLALTPSATPGPESTAFSGQIQQRLDAALGRLSGRQRTVFTLRHYDNLSLEEIAEVLNLDAGTVKAHLFRALAKLRAELKDLYFPRRAGKL